MASQGATPGPSCKQEKVQLGRRNLRPRGSSPVCSRRGDMQILCSCPVLEMSYLAGGMWGEQRGNHHIELFFVNKKGGCLPLRICRHLCRDVHQGKERSEVHRCVS